MALNFDQIVNGKTYDLSETNNNTGAEAGLDYGRTYKLKGFLDDAGNPHNLVKMIYTRSDTGIPIYDTMTFELFQDFTYVFTKLDDTEIPDIDGEALGNNDQWNDPKYDISPELEDKKEDINTAFYNIEQNVSTENANANGVGLGGSKKSKKRRKSRKSKKRRKSRKSMKSKKRRRL